MREMVLDTETTGLDPREHRIVEIGCVELVNGLPTGATFQCYINPQRSMPDDAFAVHGLSARFLSDFPVFAYAVDGFLTFIGDSPLVMHNASFDMGHLNAELQRAGRDPLDKDRAVDTLKLARQKLPGKKAGLDALCRHFDITDDREKHGALVDATLLAEVYLHLNGGRQVALDVAIAQSVNVLAGVNPSEWVPMLVKPSDAELSAHRGFVGALYKALGGRKGDATQPVLAGRHRWQWTA